MNKSIFLAVFLAFILTFSTAKAQVAEPVTSAQVEAIVKQITELQIQLLLAKIAELQTEISKLLSAQASTTQAVSQLQTTSFSPAVTAQILGVSAPAVVPAKITQFQFDGVQEMHKSAMTFTSNKSIDPSKTELWINGAKMEVTVYDTNSGGFAPADKVGEMHFTMRPSFYSFLSSTSTNEIQVKIVTTSGDRLVSDKVNYVLNKYISPRFLNWQVE